MEAITVIKAPNLQSPHGFSTRLGGVSGGIYESLNLGRLERGDEPLSVAENWRLFGAAVGIDTGAFVHGKQVHGNEIRIASKEDAHGILEPSSWEGADGYVTDVPGLPLAVFTADCTPLLMEDAEAGVVAAVHCGWRGTVADIEKNAVEAMLSLGARRDRICAAIGPGICRDCFQTGAEVPEALSLLLDGDTAGLFRPDDEPGKFRVDLPGAVERRLCQLGILKENIWLSGECTMCRPERYWSHRRLGLARGSQANIIMRKTDYEKNS